MIKKNIHTFSELETRISATSEQTKSTSESIVSIEKQLRQLGEIIKYTKQYLEYKSYHEQYKNADDKELFFRKFESQLLLFYGAERMLQRSGLSVQNMNLNKLHQEYKMLKDKEKELYSLYRTEEAELKELRLIHQNLNEFIKSGCRELSETNLPVSQHASRVYKEKSVNTEIL